MAKVTITVEDEDGITSVSRSGSVTVPGGSRPLVLPVLLSALKAAAAPYLDEIAIVRDSWQLLTNVLAAVNKDTPG